MFRDRTGKAHAPTLAAVAGGNRKRSEGRGMDLQLKGRTAIVTGASIGIGRAIAVTLAAEGVKMGVVARRRELLEKLAAEIVAAGGTKPAIIVADMMEPNSPTRIRD